MFHHVFYAALFAAIIIFALFEYTTGITSTALIMLAYHGAAFVINCLEES